MKIGFDVDGVLAWFEPAYENAIKVVTGRDLFPWGAGNPPVGGVPTWDWPQYFGYTNEEIKRVWAAIKEDSMFWWALPVAPGADTLADSIVMLQQTNEVYFITNRPGVFAKWQTENWLLDTLEIDIPTVLISSHKGHCAKALGLDIYIDDNYDNTIDVAVQSPTTRTYLLDRAYNRDLGPLPARSYRYNASGIFVGGVTRVSSVSEMFELEPSL